MKKRNRREVISIGWGLIAILVVILVMALCASLLPKPAFIRAFDSLRLGMPIDEVRSLYRADPDFEAHYRDFNILYYRPPPRRLLDTTGESDGGIYHSGARYDSIMDVPEPYAWVMLAIREDRLFAYTQVGEGYNVRTMKGVFSGSEFSEVPENVWNR